MLKQLRKCPLVLRPVTIGTSSPDVDNQKNAVAVNKTPLVFVKSFQTLGT